ncbi:hypothetical protein [Rhodanobacter sp. BL-MT-08]
MADLETVMLFLRKFGNPRLMSQTKGWMCAIDMHVNATGATFEIRSEFGHDTPKIAANECLDRVQAVLDGLSTTIGTSSKAISHG